ncbi:MAG: acyl carrier protein [Acidobacteriota bacterium]
MPLTSRINNYLAEQARAQRLPLPTQDQDLFHTGYLDSFAIIELIALIESEYRIKLKDADLEPEAVATIAKIESLVNRYQHNA